VVMLVYTADCHSERHSERMLVPNVQTLHHRAVSEGSDGRHVEAGCVVPKDNQDHECRSNSELARQTTEEALGLLCRHIFLWLGSSLPCA
jgi:hypothetical protein